MRRDIVPIALLGVCVLLAGCSTKSQRIYRRAEAFFSQGKYQLAAIEYNRLIAEAPRDTLADDAMYKLGFIYREVNGDLRGSVAWYQRLATSYLDSPYADDALMWVVEIEAQRIEDLTATRAAVAALEQRFGDDAGTCARAELQLARLLDKKGQTQEAVRVCKAIVRRPGSPRNTAAGAALLMAQVAQRTAKDAAAAEALFLAVIKNYPDTLAAVEAKQAIGWAYYGYKTKEAQVFRAEQLRRAKVLGGLGGFASVTSSSVCQLLGGLRVLLAQAGTQLSEPDIWGISGAAFQFVYHPTRPQVTSQLCAENPLTTVSEEMGYNYGVWAQSVDASEMVTIEQSLHGGRPALILYGNAHPQWTLVVGYKPLEKQVYLLKPGASAAAAVSDKQFAATWAASPSGPYWLPAARPGFQFVLGVRTAPPDPDMVARRALSRAYTMAERSSVSGVACGRRAYDVFAGEMRKAADGDMAAQLRTSRWCAEPLQSVILSRKQAAAYLRGVAGRLGGQAGAAGKAADKYDTIAQEWAEVGQLLRGGNPNAWADASLAAQRVCGDELAALEELSRLSRG